MTPQGPVLHWPGGKWRLAPWIISHFPMHKFYVEPFGGVASVLLQKYRSEVEIYNDRDNEVVNLFRVLRNSHLAEQLSRKIDLTPFSRIEFELSKRLSTERARRLILGSFMGWKAGPFTTGFKGIHGIKASNLATWANYSGRILAIAQRFSGVVVEHLDALELMLEHDSEDTLYYVDPPYILADKQDNTLYSQAYTRMDHRKLLQTLVELKSGIVLSGFEDSLYDKMLTNWKCVTTRFQASDNTYRTEFLWMNNHAYNKKRNGYLF